MIDPTVEKLITLRKAARYVNPTRPPHIATVWRWATSGVAGGIKLDSIRIGGIRHTSEEAIARFIAAINCDPSTRPEPPNHNATRAIQKLRDMGC